MDRPSIAALLADAFPAISNGTAQVPADCWVSGVLQKDTRDLRRQAGLQRLSDAVTVVSEQGQLPALKRRLETEHPVSRNHLREYDDRLLDCLTEACAFAWAHQRHLGSPAFSHQEGCPDIRVLPDLWIEAKAINRSQENKRATEAMIGGRAVCGAVTDPNPGLISKFESALADAKRKLNRQGSGRLVVFFNLTWLDESAWGLKSGVFAQLQDWAKKVSEPRIHVVVCYLYDWQNPFHDPYVVSP